MGNHVADRQSTVMRGDRFRERFSVSTRVLMRFGADLVIGVYACIRSGRYEGRLAEVPPEAGHFNSSIIL